MERKPEIVDVQTLPVVAGFNWSVGFIMEKFIKALAKKEILAARCSKCNYTYVPPRSRCGKCHTEIPEESLTPLSGKGTVIGYTTAYVTLDGNGNFVELEKPALIGAVKLDGADSTIFMPIEGVTPKNVKEGIKVQVEWRKETKGELADIQCVTVIKKN